MTTKQYSFIARALAWGVHLFTASGLVSGFMAILAINEKDWQEAMLWLLLCLLIDGIDGSFARLFKVKEVLPNVDGKTIDYVIDFATYAIIPAYFFYMAEIVPEAWQLPCVMIILMVSVLYYGKEGMVSADNFFVGFPVMWNMVVFYQIFILPQIEMLQVAWVHVFAILHFVPIKFAYPSQNTRFFKMTLLVTVLFFLMILSAVYFYPLVPLWVKGLAYATAAYYGGLGLWVTWGPKPQ
ncbi:MAG TPA: phosphatidylcholine/phosphatidylserine synthase [Phaeodactylibacter sp.]|nr:phosphatidylcholine/phosphatidylserine synthase [Phaeodactylibacter sp.]